MRVKRAVRKPLKVSRLLRWKKKKREKVGSESTVVTEVAIGAPIEGTVVPIEATVGATEAIEVLTEVTVVVSTEAVEAPTEGATTDLPVRRAKRALSNKLKEMMDSTRSREAAKGADVETTNPEAVTEAEVTINPEATFNPEMASKAKEVPTVVAEAEAATNRERVKMPQPKVALSSATSPKRRGPTTRETNKRLLAVISSPIWPRTASRS